MMKPPVLSPHRSMRPAAVGKMGVAGVLVLFAFVYVGSLFSPGLQDDADSTHAEAARRCRSLTITSRFVRLLRHAENERNRAIPTISLPHLFTPAHGRAASPLRRPGPHHWADDRLRHDRHRGTPPLCFRRSRGPAFRWARSYLRVYTLSAHRPPSSFQRDRRPPSHRKPPAAI